MACHGYRTGQFFEGEMRRDEKGRHRSRDGQDKIVSWSFTVKFALSQLLCRKDVGTCHSRQVIMHKVNHFLLFFYSFSVLKLRMESVEVVVLSLTALCRDYETKLHPSWDHQTAPSVREGWRSHTTLSYVITRQQRNRQTCQARL